MASWLVTVLFLAIAGRTIVADDLVTFPEVIRERSAASRIVSGWEAEEGQFPHQLSMRMINPAGGVTACGATIISSGWGLTAAHCTAGRVTLVLRAGALSLTRPQYIFETTKYYNYPTYDETDASRVQLNDIGLIEFGLSLTFNEYVQPIRLQRSSDKNRDYTGALAVASGWGNLWTGGASPENLNWVYLVADSNDYCFGFFGISGIVSDSTICASYYNVTSQSTCQGDSGGPLTVIDDDGEVTQIGVTSFVSVLGCHVGFPAGFVRPGHYHDWFTEVSGLNFDWEYDPTTEEPATTEPPTTEPPVTETPTTEAPTTEPPTTEAATTEAPTTEAPTTEAPTTEAPTTEAPTTEAPTTEAPTTEAPTTEAPTTEAPTTEAPTTEAPTTEAPTTEPPATEASTTEPPATEAPTTEAPTEAPTTEDVPPSSEESSKESSSSSSSSSSSEED